MIAWQDAPRREDNRATGPTPRTQFDPEKFAEVGREMLFGARIATLQSLKVRGAKRGELQASALPGNG
jgi:hypothetical protein